MDKLQWINQLSYSTAIRSVLCMMPMVIAGLTGNVSIVVPLGQGGFFNGMQLLAPTVYGRLLSTFFMIVPGLGLYLIGGNTAEYFWFAALIAFIIGISCGLLTGFPYLGMAAISGFIPMYTAGLNAGNPEAAAKSFMAFCFICLFCGIINILPFWKSSAMPIQPIIKEVDRAIMGLKLAIGLSVTVGMSIFFNFGKLGWAPSAVGSVIRADVDKSKLGAWLRASGVIGGAIIASICLVYIRDLNLIILTVLLLSAINGLTANTFLGRMPLFYNAVILILYSQTSTTPIDQLIDTRVIYNLLGIIIALMLVYYPLPLLSQAVEKAYTNLTGKPNATPRA